MKYTVEGFSQRRAIDLGLDIIDLVFLRWFIDFQATEEMKILTVGETSYCWIDYDYCINEIPIINIKNKRSFRNRLKKLVDSKILHYHCAKGNLTFYQIDSLILSSLLSDTITKNGGRVHPKVKRGFIQKSRASSLNKIAKYNNNRIDSSINDSSIINNNDAEGVSEGYRPGRQGKAKKKCLKGSGESPQKSAPPLKKFYDLYEKQVGIKYVANFGKDGKIIKGLCEAISEEDLELCMNAFFKSKDPFISKSGYDIGVFKLKINALLAEVKKDGRGQKGKSEYEDIGTRVTND